MTLGMGIAIAGMWLSIAAVLLGFRRPIIEGTLLGGTLLLLAAAVIGTVAIASTH